MTVSNDNLSEEEKCDISFDVALDEAYAVCSSAKGKIYAFCHIAALLGIDNAEKILDQCEVLLEEFKDIKNRRVICKDRDKINVVVICTAMNKMETEGLSIKTAMREAWRDIKNKCNE